MNSREISWNVDPHAQKSLGIDWASQIKYCLYAIRSAPNRSTGFTPYEIVLGKNARSPLDLLVEEELEIPGDYAKQQ